MCIPGISRMTFGQSRRAGTASGLDDCTTILPVMERLQSETYYDYSRQVANTGRQLALAGIAAILALITSRIARCRVGSHEYTRRNLACLRGGRGRPHKASMWYSVTGPAAGDSRAVFT